MVIKAMRTSTKSSLYIGIPSYTRACVAISLIYMYMLLSCMASPLQAIVTSTIHSRVARKVGSEPFTIIYDLLLLYIQQANTLNTLIE